MNASQLADYRTMRKRGVSHNLAEMFALQSPPQSSGTDSTFNEGRCNGNQFDGQEWVGDLYKAEATAAGVDVKGKYYMGSLARYPGDPEAWVDSRGDVKRVCERRGWNCRGAVNVKAADDGPLPSTPLADDIVEDKIAEVLSTVPDSKHVDVQDLREQVRDRYTPPWNKSKGVHE